jgi:hypothetical protein
MTEASLGRGKRLIRNLPFDKLGEAEFIEDFLHKIAYRKGVYTPLPPLMLLT